MVTIKDICRVTGFSTATVSRVLNNSPLVTEETKQIVEETMKRLGYRPHHIARSLKLNRTGMIAMVFPEIDHGFYTEVLRGADQAASEHSVHLLTAFSHGERDHRDLVTRMVAERRADALILMNLTLPDAFFRLIGPMRVPIVVIDRPCRFDGIASISIDNASGIRAMADHLAQSGRRRIAFITGPRGTYDADQRLRAFRAAMKARRLETPPELIWPGDFTEAGGAKAAKLFLATGRPLPDAVFAANDAMAIGALTVFTGRGIRVPNDLAIAGFDDIPAARLLQLTTIHVPMRDLGRRAALAAIEMVGDRESSRHEVLSTRLVVRASTRSEASAAPVLSGMDSTPAHHESPPETALEQASTSE